MVTAVAYHVPFAFWTFLCLGALVAFLRAVTTTPRDDLETRGVFSTLSDRLGRAATTARVRRGLAIGATLGIPLALVAAGVVSRSNAAVAGSTLVVIAVGWLFLSISASAVLVVVFGTRR